MFQVTGNPDDLFILGDTVRVCCALSLAFVTVYDVCVGLCGAVHPYLLHGV
jgi:hypothetical protein